jgi:hypothetical protein
MEPEKVVIVKPPAKGKSRKVAVEEPQQPTVAKPQLDLNGAFSMLRDLGFEISHPKLARANDQQTANVTIRKPHTQSSEDEEEAPKVIKSKKKVVKPLPKKKEESDEDMSEGDEPITTTTNKIVISDKERKEKNLPKQAVSVAKVAQTAPTASQRPGTVGQVSQPTRLNVGLGSNPLSRQKTPYGIPY